MADQPPPFAIFAADRGERSYDPEAGDRSYRTIFHHDRAEVTYSPFFRRMAYRQYHIANPGFDNRTRLLHSIEVATIASGMARRLGANVDLTDAIGLGHDIAQPPCGHPADRVIRECLVDAGGFDHGVYAAELLKWHSTKQKADPRYAQLCANPCFTQFAVDGTDVVTTISAEALDGIAKHTAPGHDLAINPPLTIEGQLVRIADGLSYISQEIDEALSLGTEFTDKLHSYAVPPLTCNGVTWTLGDLKARPAGCPEDPDFLSTMFGSSLGRRLIAMIRRIENYNTELLANHTLQFTNTGMCQRGKIPLLQIDPALRFVIDFLWTRFIGDTVNSHGPVRARAAENERKIRELLALRLRNEPTDALERAEMERRMALVRHFYTALAPELQRKRAVAYHVAVMTTQQVEAILGGVR